MVQVNQSMDVGKGYTEGVGGNRKPITSQITGSVINFTVIAQAGCWKNCCSIIIYQWTKFLDPILYHQYCVRV